MKSTCTLQCIEYRLGIKSLNQREQRLRIAFCFNDIDLIIWASESLISTIIICSLDDAISLVHSANLNVLQSPIESLMN